MMASLTTILGHDSAARRRHVRVDGRDDHGGLLFSTFATLFFVPILYALFFKIRIDR